MHKMISNKKSYAMKMLQLALALSLLQVDPDNYFNRGWDSQLELNDGEGWELEMLRAVPMVEYPYANRKTMMPLIDDLIRFDRQTNNYNVTAYLLNVHDSQGNQTGITATTTTLQEVVEPPGSVAPEQTSSTVMTNVNPNLTVTSNNGNPELDYFYNSEIVQDQLSVWEQNIADLNDFGDMVASNVYAGLPLKEEPSDNLNFDFYVRTDDKDNYPSEAEGAAALNDTFPSRSISDFVKLEPRNDTGSEIPIVPKVKANDSDCVTNKKDCSPFMTSSELTKEESEIVEVLWKQDVDLGYSLSPPILSNNNSAGEHSKASDDDIDKLKALEELKRDEYKEVIDDITDDIDDEWAGIPFTIDNETGEYIRLPLDELLNDVLQLAELAAEESESNENNNNNDDCIASTSQAANNKAKFQSSEVNRTEATASTTTTFDSSEATLATEDDLPQSEIEVSSLPSPFFDLDDEAKEELADLDMMIQSATPPFHHRSMPNYAAVGGANSAFRQSTGFHHSHHQGRAPSLSRGVSMEQRLQDIANLFNPIPGMGVGVGVGEMPPYPHYPTHYPYQGGNSIPPPQHNQYGHSHSHHHMMHNTSLGDICPTQPHYGHNLGSAVSSSMHLTNSNHDSDVGNGNSSYKLEHEMMYYSNASSDLNHTTDGFINSILNDEDLHLMDMNVTDNFCSMRMVDVNTTSNNSSVLGSTSGLSSSGGQTGGTSASGNLLPVSMSTGHSMHSGGGSGIHSGASVGITTEIMAVGGTDRLDASSDSAVSSMGSERVPSLSDGEWGEGSDSAQDYHHSKYGGPYDYSYNNRLNDGSRQQPPVAQKKHQMFGKRYLQEQPTLPPSEINGIHSTAAIKYEYETYANAASTATTASGMQHANTIDVNTDGAVGGPPLINKNELHHLHPMSNGMDIKYGGYSLDFALRPPRTPHDIINHNHTYTLPQGTGSNPRPQQRDKKSRKNSEDEHLTRDEKRARSMNVPISVADIINLPMDEFNERLSKYDLTENQLSLIRDIRRRGKNKVAAQNCRKRKLDQIVSLEDEVKEVRRRKDHLCRERDMLGAERKRIANKFTTLHRHIFQYLRDPEGNPCSPLDYSLQQAADGSIYLLPREHSKPESRGLNGSTCTSTNSNSNIQHASHHNQHQLHQQNHQRHNLQQHQHQQQQQQQQQLVIASTGGATTTISHPESHNAHSQQSSSTPHNQHQHQQQVSQQLQQTHQQHSQQND